MTTTTTFEKSIRYDRQTRDYRAELEGQLIGYYPSYHAAEEALDDVAYEMLTHGDCATAEELDGGIEDAPVQLASWSTATASADPPAPETPIILTEPETPPVYPEEGGRCIACHTAIDVPSARHACTCIHCANAMHFGLANRFAAVQHVQDLLDRQRARVCVNCGGAHTTWQCPEVAKRLFAPDARDVPAERLDWKDIALGRELCRMRWKDFGRFVALIAEVQARGHLSSYARSYQAFMASYSPDTNLTVDQVLTVWDRIIGEAAQCLPVAA